MEEFIKIRITPKGLIKYIAFISTFASICNILDSQVGSVVGTTDEDHLKRLKQRIQESEAELLAANHALASQTTRLQQLEEEYSIRGTEMDRQQGLFAKQKIEFEKELDVLRNQLREVMDKFDKSRGEVGKLAEENRVLMDKLSASNDDVQVANDCLVPLKHEINYAKDEIRIMSKEIDRLKNELKEKESQLAEKTYELAGALRNSEKISADLKKLEVKVSRKSEDVPSATSTDKVNSYFI